LIDIRPKEAFKEASMLNSISIPTNIADETGILPKLEAN
jgi:hypothetical protein